MGLFHVRDVVPFPAGDNSSDTIFEGIHWNLTTLNHWNYTHYSNGTISNGSSCFLLFKPYTPFLLQNGTFLNSTSCYSPIKPLGARSGIGIAFASIFFLSIMFTFVNLRKHGRLFLPTEKRFRAVGRRWQWYWMLVTAALATISGITGVDVDRYYLPQLPMVLTNFFWFLMLPCTMAIVWESVRHWGSWQERQMIDPNPFTLRQDDRRSQVEFFLPLVFYLFWWLAFFMIVPRSWGSIEKQRDIDQARLIAKPHSTDTRFKAAAFLLFCGWLTTVFSLHHSIKHYKPRNRGLFNRAMGLLKYIPTKFLLTLPLSLLMIGYQAAIAFSFSISPLNYIDPHLATIYALGWGPITLILLVYEVAGYFDPNEDKELLRQRRIRGQEADLEIGIVKKPNWWSRLHGNNEPISVSAAIARNVKEIGGGQATTKNLERNIEMGNITVSKTGDPETSGAGGSPEGIEAVRLAAGILFPAQNNMASPAEERYSDQLGRGRREDERTPPRVQRTTTTSNRSESTSSGTTLGGYPQQVRSMLDV